MSETYDYVIVGAGSAGSTLAARLSDIPGVRICLLEAGPKDLNPFLHIPAGFIKVIFDPKLTWGFMSEPGDAINGRSVPAIQGKVVGGSGAVNGMIYVRGQADDFNRWAQMGNPGWGYDDVLPYFRKSESRREGGDQWRGDKGQMPIFGLDLKNDLVDAFIGAAGELGIPRNPDYNGASQAGAGIYQYNIGGGRRMAPGQAFLRPALKRGAIDLRTGARATQVLFDGTRATGIRYTTDNGSTFREVKALREVILCGGAINTPRLLQVSGVGNPELLKSIGAPVVHALPGVGENLHDHFTPRTVVKVHDAVTINDMARGPRLIGQGIRWLLRQPSIIGMGVVLGNIFWKSHPDLDRPDMLVTFTPGSFREGFLGKLDVVPGMTLGAWQLRPESTGFIRARSRDLFEAPMIQPNYLTAENDRRVLLSGQKLIRRLLGTQALGKYVTEELMPGPAVQSDDELMDYARRQGLSGYHFCGTAKMGPASDPMAVVDARLKVHGLQGLRVVDASVMPSITSGNTHAPTIMIAEKAADMVRGDWG